MQPRSRSISAIYAVCLLVGCAAGAAAAEPRGIWGPIQRAACTRDGIRRMRARLWDVPPGASAVETCNWTPRNVMGIEFPHPTDCVREQVPVHGPTTYWGEWEVPDTTCLELPPPTPVPGGTGTLSSAEPLEGFADIHIHEMGNLGFGGSILWGGSHGDPAKVLGPIPAEMRRGHNATQDCFDGHYLRCLLSPREHGEDGYESFGTWPSREKQTHQQAYVDWLHRAYLGGMRLMVMLAVNSEDSFGRGENHIPIVGGVRFQKVHAPHRSSNDMEALEWQVREAYRLQAEIDEQSGGQGKGWYRIVRDPDEASQVVADRKLAVILGSELQHLLNCDVDRPRCTKAHIVEGLNRLEGMGVNYVFPIHHKLNQYGGPTQFQPLNSGRKYVCHAAAQGCSKVGLTRRGTILVKELMSRGMLVDTEHMSWRAFDATMKIAEERDYPVMAGHVSTFDLGVGEQQTEQWRTTEQLNRVLAVGGVIGIIPEVKTGEYSPSADGPLRVPIACGGASDWANAYLYIRGLASQALEHNPGVIALGSDWNGFAHWPAPRFGKDACKPRHVRSGEAIHQAAPVKYPIELPRELLPAPAALGGTRTLPVYDWMGRRWNYNDEGMQHVGLTPDFVQDLRQMGLTVADLEPFYRSARGNVDTWKKARARTYKGNRHHVRWVSQSPFDVLEFEYADVTRDIAPQAGSPLCRSRVGHHLGFVVDGRCRLVDSPSAESPSQSSSASVELPPSTIVAYHAGRCLDVRDGSTREGARAVQEECKETPRASQLWRLRSNARGELELVNMNSGLCLEVEGSSLADGAAIRQVTCTGLGNQLWKRHRVGNTFALINVNSDRCAAVADQSRSFGAQVNQFECDGTANGQWEIESLRADDYELAYQADKNRIAWLAAPDAIHSIEVTVDEQQQICQPLDSGGIGVVRGDECVGATYSGAPLATKHFERLYQEP